MNKEYLKSKMKGIKGAATLEPPSGDIPALQSVSSMAVLDLLSEGPIYGLVDRDGKKANNINILESLYLDDTPVLATNLSFPTIKTLQFKKVQLIQRCTSGHMRTAFQNIRNELDKGKSANTNNQYMSSVKKAELDAESGLFCKFVEENPIMGNYGFVQYKLSGIFPTGDTAADRIYSRANFNTGVIGSYGLTCFELDGYLGGHNTNNLTIDYPHLYSRSSRNSKNEVVDMPSPIHYGYQFFNNNLFSYSASPERISMGEGKVGHKFIIDGFMGGGIIFFHIGNNDAEDNNGNFDTGKFFLNRTNSSINFQDKLQSGIDNGYDVFMHNGDGVISLERPSPTQMNPPVGHCAGKTLGVGFYSDVNLTYNYGNIDFDFRDGFEEQPQMEGHSEGAQDFDIRKKLFGPLQYTASTATDGDGEGYADVRGEAGEPGVDFSDWMLNPPLESDPFPYTHTVKRIDVKKAIPTIAIEGLGDTVATGDDAGTQKAETLKVSYTIGFEGGVTGTSVSDLLSAGNSLQSIVLGNFQSTETITHSGIVTSNYLHTFSGINDLPSNKSLRDLKINSADISVDNALASQYGYTAGDNLFPGDEWKLPNRFLKVQKESFETDSTLIDRECSLQYVTETIGQKFNYPLAAMGGTVFDARNFAQQPQRAFEIKGKLVSVPSNYNPLNADGKDKRFIKSAIDYGKRSIYKFSNQAGSFGIVYQDIILGTDNFRIKGKVQFGTISETAGNAQFIIDTRASETSANRIAIFQGDNKITLGVRDGAGIYSQQQVSISNHPQADNPVFEFDLLRVGRNLSMTVNRIYTRSLSIIRRGLDDVNSSSRVGFVSITVTNDLDLKFTGNNRQLIIGAKATSNPSTQSRADGLSNNSQIADLQIFKNNQLIHHWDGTVNSSLRHNKALNEKVNGYHASINDTTNGTELDTNFKFGRNKTNIYNGLWDGSFKLAWTDNPAWILYDLMINPIYGVGNSLDDREDINIFNLYQIARYCDAVDDDGFFEGVLDATKGLEPRFSCNLRIQDSKNAFETLGNIASIFRGFSYWDGVGLNFSIDRDKEISAIFNNGNVFDGIFNYGDILSSARFTKVEVIYADANDLYGSKVEYIEDEDAIRRYGLITKTLNGIGATSKSQARRKGKYVLFSNRMETEVAKFRAGTECLFLEPGDIIRIDDELKNFEINYGKVLEVDTDTTQPSITVEKSIDSENIDGNGTVYLYTNRKQTELEELYDIANFSTVYSFGENSDTYSGVVNSDFIDTQSLAEIEQINVTGISVQKNKLKLLIENSRRIRTTLNQVQTGTFANVELNNNVNQTYKVVKKEYIENNLYDIEALEYDIDKFNKIEQDDFDDVENTHNIGIPANTINRPSAPTVTMLNNEGNAISAADLSNLTVTNGLIQRSDTTYAVSGRINASTSSNETSYRVAVYRTNQAGTYTQKEVAREDNNDPTFFECNGLIAGDYKLQVTALRNPESSSAATSSFTIESKPLVYLKPLIKKIEINDDSSQYTRISGSGLGTGQSRFDDVQYNFVTVNKKNEAFRLSEVDYSMDIYVEKTSGKFINLELNYKDNAYIFDDVANATIFDGVYNSGFNMRFDLKKNGALIDTAIFETNVV